MQTHIYVPPTALDATWRDSILRELNRRYQNTCFPGDGFVITTIHGIRTIHDMMITSTTGHVRFLLDFYATTFLPKAGTQIRARIDILSQHGIILSHPYIQIIVPTHQLKKDGYDLKSSFSSVTFASPQQTLLADMIITVELMSTRYENHTFFSIARLCVKHME